LFDGAPQCWDISLGRDPHDLEVDAKVAVDKEVAHSCDLLPGDIGTKRFRLR
jgi:hypothetical protein